MSNSHLACLSFADTYWKLVCLKRSLTSQWIWFSSPEMSLDSSFSEKIRSNSGESTCVNPLINASFCLLNCVFNLKSANSYMYLILFTPSTSIVSPFVHSLCSLPSASVDVKFIHKISFILPFSVSFQSLNSLMLSYNCLSSNLSSSKQLDLFCNVLKKKDAKIGDIVTPS